MVITIDGLAQELRQGLRGRVLVHEPMARYTSFRIGGPADLVVVPQDVADLTLALALARSAGLPVQVHGGGSNSLIRDGGIRGMVILLSAFQELLRSGDEVAAGVGVRVGRLLAFCSRQDLAGLEILSGVPGTVGGAVWGNAGAWGGSAADRLARVHLLTAEGEEMTLAREAIPARYRSSGLPAGSVITRAVFGLTPDEPGAVRRRISGYLVERNLRQPVEFRSAGSIFKNPPGDYAGRLVEAAGVKGARIGGAMISEKHGNFVVNLGGARAADVLALVELARERVRAMTGILLELEIRVVGED
jgi:UDP-N-acetylmuramate dehydrogenase